MKEIIDAKIVHFEEAISLKDGVPYQDWRRAKYIGKDGILLIIRNNSKKHIQWHPIDIAGNIIVDKGLVSTDDDISEDVEKHIIKVETQNSVYYFTQVCDEIGDIELPIIL